VNQAARGSDDEKNIWSRSLASSIARSALSVDNVLNGSSVAPKRSTGVSKFDIERFRIVLDNIKEDLKKKYYDPIYHGMDLDARFKTADETIRQATSLGQILGTIAQVMLDLNPKYRRKERLRYEIPLCSNFASDNYPCRCYSHQPRVLTAATESSRSGSQPGNAQGCQRRPQE